MNSFFQLVVSLLTLSFGSQFQDTETGQISLAGPAATNVTKSIAIVGGGTAGVSVLKTLLVDLPEEERQGWEVVLFDQRHDVGGIWLPDPQTPHPPVLPETPLYPRLKTNTPHPTMTIPRFPFKPDTALYPQHPYVQQYHADIIMHWNLSSHLKLNHEVLQTQWHGTSESGYWKLDVKDRVHDRIKYFDFDHLIIANGHNHYPFEPEFEGRDLWEAPGKNRTFIHSIFYRNPEDYKGKNVLVVGGGASGRDVAQQIVGFANSTYVSLKAQNYTAQPFPNIPGAEYKPRIERFTEHAIVFDDSTTLTHTDTVILGTGYEYRIPFLTAGGHLPLAPHLSLSPDDHLSTNLRYIRPLYRHVLSLDPAYPLGALYFVGLPIFVANAISDTAQALFAAHTLAHPALLSARPAFLADLVAQEARLRAGGHDPAYVGHRLVGEQGAREYQDGLVAYLQARGRGGWPGVPRAGVRFTEEWRTFGRNETLVLRKAWERVEGEGEAAVRAWLAGVETEEEWADLMVRLVEWESRKEGDEGAVDRCG